MSKDNVERKKQHFVLRNFHFLQNPESDNVKPYYPVSAQLSVKWLLTGDKLKVNLR